MNGGASGMSGKLSSQTFMHMGLPIHLPKDQRCLGWQLNVSRIGHQLTQELYFHASSCMPCTAKARRTARKGE